MIRLYLILIGIILIVFGVRPAFAQEPLRFLTDNLNPNTGNVSLVWVNLAQNSHQNVVSFNAPSYCPIHFSADTLSLYFEPANFDSSTLYLVNLENGNSTPQEKANQMAWSCPTPNPRGDSIAWLQKNLSEIVVTDANGENPIVLASYEGISDVLWSPDGDVLIYATSEGRERPLYAHGEAQHAFWQAEVGLAVDYEWLPDSSALLVSYYTESALVLGRLERNCVETEICLPVELARFSPRASLILTPAIQANRAVIIEEQYNERGELNSDLYLLDVALGGVERLTSNPEITKTSVLWTDRIYFVGADFDVATFQVTQSAIYGLDPQTKTLEVVYQAPDYYPVQILKIED